MLSFWRDCTGQSHFVVPCRENNRGSSLGHELGRIERKKHSVMGSQGGKGQFPLKGLWARNSLQQHTGLLQQRPEVSWAQVMTLWLTLIHTDPASCGSLQQPLDPSVIRLMAQLVTESILLTLTPEIITGGSSLAHSCSLPTMAP